MKLMMHILKKNEKLGIDNETIGLDDIGEKLKEEYKEVQTELFALILLGEEECLKNLMRETFDLIQMCILILNRCHKMAKDIEEPELLREINLEHCKKLSGRGWIAETGIKIKVLE